MGNNKKKKRKILRLDLSRSERAFYDEEECLWDSEISKMEERLEAHVKTLKPGSRDGKNSSQGKRPDIEELPLLSIAIFGSPGSGKSSLLRTFIRKVKKGDSNSTISAKVNSLPVIKPNTMVRDDNFLYSFLAAALKEDRERNESKSVSYRDSPILTPLQQKFQEVSEYLQVINQPERPPEDDPLGVSLERLERHESGFLLKEKLNEFIDQLADTLTVENEGSVVLLPVDDPDMSQDMLVSTFDTCWRYLQHPRLVPVFTFTGRLAEELLRVHFEERLNIEGNADSSKKLVEAATSLRLTETMALQYMGKLFPVRNRIRLGPAAARVLGANYKPPDPGKSAEEKDVNGLLETVSRLLFGHAPKLAPQISAPLRLVTLRRQLQIVDAMQGTGIENIQKKEEDGVKKNKKSWGQYFDLATWSLLNTHRDILKEIDMNLDDLYGWTPLRLCQVVRDSILSLPLKRRRKLLTSWRYRTMSRRSQMLSLLAANVFRPRMEGIEPSGDNPEIIKNWPKEKKEMENRNERDLLSFSVREGVLWFLDICIGFYLPQVMACNFPDIPGESKNGGNSSVDSITGVGWDFVSGPRHAIREAVYNKDMFFSGIVFIHPETMNEIIKKANKAKKGDAENLLLLLWCYYGYNEGTAWAAVSLWRGLGLIGRLLKMKQKIIDREKEGKKKTGIDVDDEIQFILKDHLDACKVIGNSPKHDENYTISSSQKIKFTPLTVEPGNDIIDINGWLYPGEKEKRKDEKKIYPLSSTTWETCFVRRLHGKNLLNQFWRKLENVYFDVESPGPPKGNSGGKAGEQVRRLIDSWKKVLESYWGSRKANPDDNNEVVKNFFESCPFFKPEEPLNKE